MGSKPKPFMLEVVTVSAPDMHKGTILAVGEIADSRGDVHEFSVMYRAEPALGLLVTIDGDYRAIDISSILRLMLPA